MGAGTKFQIMSEILRAVHEESNTIKKVLNLMKGRPLVKGNEIISLIVLAKQFGFLSGNENILEITNEGLSFMGYVETEIPKRIEKVEAEISEDVAEIKKDVKKDTAELITKILGIGNKIIETSPDLESSNTFLTVTLPPRKEIPVEYRSSIILNQEAEKRVMQDCEQNMIIVSPYIEVNALKFILHQSYIEDAELLIITSDKDNFDRPYWKKNLNAVIKQHFKKGRILKLIDEQMIAHAKIWLSEKSVLITSANVLTNSQTNNFEMGIYTDNQEIVKSCKKMIDEILPLCKEVV